MGAPQPGKTTPLASRKSGQPTTIVSVGDVRFGDRKVVLIGGPCAVEDSEQMSRTAAFVAAAGGSMLRGGAWKPRTNPYDFQGLGKAGLEILAEARKASGLPVVTEVLDPRDVELVAESADMLQIGSRSVQNFPLLREVGASGKPVLLKRGMTREVPILFFANGVSGLLKPAFETPWISVRWPFSRKSRICPLSLIPATPPVMCVT